MSSREIKFRVYDKTAGYYVAVLGNDCFGIKQVARIILELDTLKHEYIVEQYTGLKDKNDKEICEGDILLDDSGEPLEYWVVKHEYGKFVGETQGVSEDIYELTDLEVIGNIHENPELLESTC